MTVAAPLLALTLLLAADEPATPQGYTTERIVGWTVHVSDQLRKDQPEQTVKALEMLAAQLKIVEQVVPKGPLAEIRKVPLWVSPPYEGFGQRAEYHPDAGWLKANKRDVALARCVEFTNSAIFEAEIKRMPVFVLHELAHAYHHRVLSFEHAEVKAAFDQAVAAKSYEEVKRNDGQVVKHYALTNPQEYFAELSESYFGTNDFYPFNRTELAQHDPEMHKLLTKLWQVEEK